MKIIRAKVPLSEMFGYATICVLQRKVVLHILWSFLTMQKRQTMLLNAIIEAKI